MSEVKVLQMPTFKRSYKKLHQKQKSTVNEAIREIIRDPQIGQTKKGDLAGVHVYKFKIQKQEMLLAYE